LAQPDVDAAVKIARAGGDEQRADRLVLIALCLASSLSVTNALALAPFLADIGRDVGASVALIGQAATAASLVGASLGLVIGPAAEWFGYRRLMLAGFAALVVSNVATALAPSFGALVAAQVAGGIGGATISPMAFAIAGLRFDGERRRRAISRIYAATAGAEVVALPLLAFIGDQTVWRWSFIVLAITGAASLAFAATSLPRDVINRASRFQPRAVLGTYAPLLRSRALLLVYVAQFLRGVAWTGMLTYAGAFLIEELGISLQAAGLIWVVLGPGFLIGSLMVAGPLRRFDARLTFTLTTAAMGLLIGYVFLRQPDVLLVFAALLLTALVGGIAEVTAATILSTETPATQAATMALHASTLRYGTATGALAGGVLLAGGSYTALGYGLPLIALAACVACRLSRRGSAAADTLSAAPG
jgi:predicted MFS family arabinose efflux permease